MWLAVLKDSSVSISEHALLTIAQLAESDFHYLHLGSGLQSGGSRTRHVVSYVGILHSILSLSNIAMPILFSRLATALGIASLLLLPLVYASSGDRNPTFQHCLRGCAHTYCDPSRPPIPFYLRLFGWTCSENCAYQCSHSFTNNIRPGSRYHQCKFLLHLVGRR